MQHQLDVHLRAGRSAAGEDGGLPELPWLRTFPRARRGANGEREARTRSPALGAATALRRACGVAGGILPGIAGWPAGELAGGPGWQLWVNASVSVTKWNLESAVRGTRRSFPESSGGFHVTKSVSRTPTWQRDAAPRRGDPEGHTGQGVHPLTPHGTQDLTFVLSF